MLNHIPEANPYNKPEYKFEWTLLNSVNTLQLLLCQPLSRLRIIWRSYTLKTLSILVGIKSSNMLLKEVTQGPGGHPAPCAPSWRQSVAPTLPHHHLPGNCIETGALIYSDLVFIFTSKLTCILLNKAYILYCNWKSFQRKSNDKYSISLTQSTLHNSIKNGFVEGWGI